jgi:peptide/nickel transport system substrate-binding protein
MKQPLFSFWNDLVNRIAGPYPPEVVTKYGSLKDWKNWVSTGPFIMTDFVADSSATFKKNPSYWGTDELRPGNKIPYIDGISWLWIVDNAARTAAFRTRKIDMIPQLDQTTVTSVMKTNPEVIEVYRLTTGNGRAFFNMNEAPFNDVRVRQALWMAIDFNSIVRDYYGGIGEPRGFPMDSNGSWYTPTDQLPTAYVDPVTGAVTNLQDLWTYQPAKAQALLKIAGFPSGLTFDMTINSQYTEQALILQSYWKAIGANATIVPKDPNATAALRYSTGGIAAFKGCLFIQSGGSPDPSDMDQQTHTNSAWNTGGFSSAYYDKTYNSLVGRMDLGPVQKEMVDLSFYVMSQCIRLDFPLQVQSALMHPWIINYAGTGNQTGPAPYGLCHAARLWIDPVVKKKYTGK